MDHLHHRAYNQSNFSVYLSFGMLKVRSHALNVLLCRLLRSSVTWAINLRPCYHADHTFGSEPNMFASASLIFMQKYFDASGRDRFCESLGESLAPL